MRDSVAMEVGDQTVATSPDVDAPMSSADEEPESRNVPEPAMVTSVAGRDRRSLWAILSFLFVLGIAVSTIMVRSERNGALDAVVKGAHDQAQLATDAFTSKQLAKPVTGSSYDKLANKVWKSVSSDGTIVGVTIWSSEGQILFSLNESLVGKTPPEMGSLITGIAKGSGSSRVLDEQVQTFTSVSKGATRTVVAEIDQPLAVVDAQDGDLWSTLRLASVFGLAVSLLFLGLTFVSSKSSARAAKRERGPKHDERRAGDVGAELNAEGREEAPTDGSRRTYEEIFGLQGGLDQTVEHDGDLASDPERLESDPGVLENDPEDLEEDPEDLEGDPEAVKSIRQWDEHYEDIVQEELQTQELMRQRREEFKARAEAAALRVKKQEAEPEEAPATPD